MLNSNGFLADADEADCIFHADESGFSTDPNQRKMFFKKSSKDRYLLTPTSGKAMYTVLVCGSASGLFMSPLVVLDFTYGSCMGPGMKMHQNVQFTTIPLVVVG